MGRASSERCTYDTAVGVQAVAAAVAGAVQKVDKGGSDGRRRRRTRQMVT